ncbi:NAD(P)/FAD-dependent oxidoreductase [Candidatus Micrarchaeota archaeon]|nr:NAD(P)/FAD-dependent oxidoreductase [Candidatus Micrarchaeota archaeon]
MTENNLTIAENQETTFGPRDSNESKHSNDVVFDVLIIGAGPAGGSAAWHCSKSGLKTMVLEEHQAIGEPVHCGECLSQVACDRMGWILPPEAIAMPVKGVRVIFPGNKTTKLTEEGYVLEKHRFEQWIMRMAQKDGAQVALGKKVTTLKRDAETQIWTVSCADGSSFQSKILMDATGVAALVSRLLNLNPRFQSVIGIQYEMKDIPTDGYMDFFIWPELAPHGYLWMIPKGNGRANIGLVTNDNTKAKIYLDQFVAKMGWKDKVVVKTFGGLIPASGPLQNTVSDGVMLIGDAAGFTSPLFEGGSHLGLVSGRYAAKVARKAVTLGDTSKKFLSQYEMMWKAEFPDYQKLIGGKHALYDMTDNELEFVGSIMPKELSHITTMERIKFGSHVLVRKPGLLGKGLLSALEAFGYSRAESYGW